MMNLAIPNSLLIIAGRDAYPRMLLTAARKAGVQRIVLIGFKGETPRETAAMADEVHWVPLGSIRLFLDTIQQTGVKHAVMVGQIGMHNVFHLRLDKMAMKLYRSLESLNAHTIYGTIADEIENRGIEVLPGNVFMECYTPEKGQLSRHAPTDDEWADIALGLKLVKGTSEFEIGQTVALKKGVIVAVEAWEGTNQTIKRAGKVGKAGTVIVKLPKTGHDMRFDIPVVGAKTFKVMKRAKVSCLAVEAGKTILLEKEKLIALADQYGMAFVAIKSSDELEPTHG